MPTPIEAYKRTIMRTERAKGTNSAQSKIFAEIFASPTEICIEELANKTGYSLATVSNTIKSIELNGIAIKVKKPGSKKVYMKAERDFMKVLMTNINRTYETTIRPLKQTLPELIKAQKKLIKETKTRNNKTANTQKQKNSGETKEKEQLKKELEVIEKHLEQTNLMETMFDHVITQCNKNRKAL